jgi:hypothetical protein
LVTEVRKKSREASSKVGAAYRVVESGAGEEVDAGRAGVSGRVVAGRGQVPDYL